MAKTVKELEKELEEANAAREAAEKKAEEAKQKAAEEVAAAKASEQKAKETEEEIRQKNEELLKRAEEAEKASMKDAENFFKKEKEEGPEFEMMKFKFPTLRGKDADPDIVITVNGREWQIRRGVYVEIPRYVLEAYRCSEKAEQEADDFIREAAYSPE